MNKKLWEELEFVPAEPDVIVETTVLLDWRMYGEDLNMNRLELECNRKLESLRAKHVHRHAELLGQREKEIIINEWMGKSPQYIRDNLVELTSFCHAYNLNKAEILVLLVKDVNCMLCRPEKCNFKCGKWSYEKGNK